GTAGGRGHRRARQSSEEVTTGKGRRVIDPCVFLGDSCIYKERAVMDLAEHPTVRHFHESPGPAEPKPLDAAWLRQLCLACGADDAGLVKVDRPALDDQRDDILRYFPPTRTLVSFACRMNRGPIRSPARSAANLEFHGTYDHSNEVARKVVAAL